jgi:hypothetical protein
MKSTGYTLADLLITIVFFAVTATVAARAIHIDASRPPAPQAVPPGLSPEEILRACDRLVYDPDDPIWRSAETVQFP